MLHYKFNNAWHSIKRRLLDFDDGRLKDILKLGCKGIECAFEREATKAIANITQCIDMIKTLPKKEGVGGQEALHLAKAHALMLEGKRINYAILQRHPDIKNNMFAKKEFIWVLTAQREYKKALRLSDGICCPRIFNCRGICFYMLGQKRLAVKEFKKSLLLSPAYTPARNNLRLIKKTQ
jgi:hypothetical protein